MANGRAGGDVRSDMRSRWPVLLLLLVALVLGLGGLWLGGAAGWLAPAPAAPVVGAPPGPGRGEPAPAGPSTANAVVAAGVPGVRERVPADLVATGVLHGRVFGPAGRPVPGAAVVVSASSIEGARFLDRQPVERAEFARATTDADGCFRLVVPPQRPLLVVVTAEGFPPERRGACAAGDQVDFHLRRGATLTGTVREAATRRGVPDTGIQVRQEVVGLGLVTVRSTTTDAEGRYRLVDLPGGPVVLGVTPRELAAPRDVDLVLPAGGVLVHDLELLAGITIRGTVLAADTGSPIAGAEVGEGLVGRAVVTDAAGAFELVGFAPLANLSLRVRAPGYGGLEYLLRGRDSRPEDTPTAVEIRLQPGHTAAGIVHDPAGRPRAGVYVAAVAADHDGPDSWFRSDWRSARTAADGSFTLSDLRTDLQHELLIVEPGFARLLLPFPADEARLANVELGVLVLRPAGEVRGVVRDEAGVPVVGHMVRLRGHNADRDPPGRPAAGYRAIDSYVAERTTVTDAVGGFAFHDLAAGDHEVQAPRFGSHDFVVAKCAVPSGGVVGGIELVLWRGLSIEGRVVASDAGALPKCYVSIDPAEGQGTSGDVEVAADGAFVADGLAPGGYRLSFYPYPSEVDRVAGRLFAAQVLEPVAAGSRGVSCALQVQRPVRGRVVDADQAPVRDQWVALFDGEREVGSAQTEPDGSFTIPAAPGVVLWVGTVPPPNPEHGYSRPEVAVGTVAAAGGDPVLLVLPR